MGCGRPGEEGNKVEGSGCVYECVVKRGVDPALLNANEHDSVARAPRGVPVGVRLGNGGAQPIPRQGARGHVLHQGTVRTRGRESAELPLRKK